MPIHGFVRSSVFAAFTTFAFAIPALAQQQQSTGLDRIAPGPKRVDISGSGGFLLPTDWSDLVLLGSISPISGALEQILARDLVVDPGPVFEATVTYWEGRYGFRVHGGFAQSCLAVGRTCSPMISLGRPISAVDVDTYIYDVGGAIGLIDYRADRWAWPYFYFGGGAVTYNLSQSVGPPLIFIEQRPPRGGGSGQISVSIDDPDTLLITADELGIETKFALNFGIGTDFRIPAGASSFGVRFEVGDNMHASPFDLTVSSVELPAVYGRDTILGFGLVHNLRAAVGVVVQFGR